MRPGQHQQNRRGRGRNNGNGNSNSNSNSSSSVNAGRKGQNPLSRSFESNGPDVKVRGTPAHIAEKYQTLARDAQSSGDRVLAENYLQHAEHYNRIIMAYREQFQQPGEATASTPRRMSGTDGFELSDEVDGDEGGNDGSEDFGGGPQPGAPAIAVSAEQQGGGQQQQRPQPFRQDNRQEGRFDRNGNNNNANYDRGGDNQNRGDRPFRRDGQQNNRFRDRNDRNNRPYNGNPPDRGPNDRPAAGERPYEPRFERDRGDNRNENRGENRTENRGDFRQDRGPRPDRPVRIDRPETGQSAPHVPAQQPHIEATPAPMETSGLPAFVAAALPTPPPAQVSAPAAIPTVAPSAPSRRRERAAEQPVAGVASDTPEFLRRPVRRTRATTAVPAADAPPVAPVRDSEDPSSTS